MGIINLFVLTVVVLCYSASGIAATLIETMGAGGSTEKTWIEGSKMRIESSNDPNYMLFHAETGKMYAINTEEKEALDLSTAFRGGSSKPAAKKFDAKFIKVGQGPLVAGYATEHYQFIVNGRKCSDEFLSKKVMDDFRSLKIFESLEKEVHTENMDFGMGMMDPCDSAEVSFEKTYQKLGFPLKTMDSNGSTDSEVMRISSNASVPAGGLDIPPGYRVVDMEQKMQESMQGNFPGQPGRGMPSQEGMMGGQEMDPEKLQQMLQEMMQQMGQEK